jgi:MFS family permease
MTTKPLKGGDGDGQSASAHDPSDLSHFHRIELNSQPLATNMFTPEMALMWLVSFAVWGATTIVSGNSSQIYQALDFNDYNDSTNTVYVSIYGVASAVGRIIVGFLQPVVEKRRHISLLFPIAPVINMVALPLFLVISPKALILPFFLVGLATGVTWGSTVLIVKSLFVPENCGKHYNILYTAGMLTPIVMNVGIFGPLYDRESHGQGREDTHACEGIVCIQWALVVSIALNVAAFPCAIFFYRRVTSRGGIHLDSSRVTEVNIR